MVNLIHPKNAPSGISTIRWRNVTFSNVTRFCEKFLGIVLNNRGRIKLWIWEFENASLSTSDKCESGAKVIILTDEGANEFALMDFTEIGISIVSELLLQEFKLYDQNHQN